MALVLLSALLACGAALLRGGRFPRGRDTGVRRLSLLVAALAVQVAGALLLPAEGAVQVAALLASFGLAGAFVAVNLALPGLPLVGLGVAANSVVIAANGAMPVSLDAAGRAGLREEALALVADPRHETMTDATRLSWLGDVIAFPVPVVAEVVSVGDVLTAAGVALALWTVLLAAASSRPSSTPAMGTSDQVTDGQGQPAR